MVMSVPLTTSLAELMSVGAIPYMRTSPAGSFVSCYFLLVHTPPNTIFLDVALFPTCPTNRGFLFIRGSLAFTLVGAILGMRCGGGGSRSVGGWFIPTSEVGGRVRDR